MLALPKKLQGKVEVSAVAPDFATTGLNGFLSGGKMTRRGCHHSALLGPQEKDKTCIMGDWGQVPW
ncbi:hypothetical protein BDZ89DRAFT_1129219 [Hymenopellis radicata]|nr:hypothetical protein BDZ89DRAFT_1129219 [Hymenopellis radicata]